MVVLSVQISVKLSVLKGWGLHPLDHLATLVSWNSSNMARLKDVPALCSLTLLEQLFECYISTNLFGPFQTVFRCARVGEIHAFGRYLKYAITPSDQPAFADVGCQEKPRDAFRIMMDAQLVLRMRISI